MLYAEVTLNDLQREFQLEGSRPRHAIAHPRTSFALIQTGLDGVIDSLLATQHVLEMFRRSLPAVLPVVFWIGSPTASQSLLPKCKLRTP